MREAVFSPGGTLHTKVATSSQGSVLIHVVPLGDLHLSVSALVQENKSEKEL